MDITNPKAFVAQGNTSKRKKNQRFQERKKNEWKVVCKEGQRQEGKGSQENLVLQLWPKGSLCM